MTLKLGKFFIFKGMLNAERCQRYVDIKLSSKVAQTAFKHNIISV